jgi:ribosomal protein S18 acetylase RimI-like enzyme
MVNSEWRIANNESAVVVRPATVEDMPRVGEVLVEGFSHKFGVVFGQRIGRAPRVLAQMSGLWLERGLCTLFVAQMGERLSDLWGQLRIMLRGVGPLYTLRATVGLALLHEETVENTAYVSDVAVATDFRGRGIGWRLLESAEGWAQAHGKESLSLHVVASNRARGLYERFGFRLEKRIEEWLAERLFGIRAWLYMVKPLSARDDAE